jgi:hypothetical protein
MARAAAVVVSAEDVYVAGRLVVSEARLPVMWGAINLAAAMILGAYVARQPCDRSYRLSEVELSVAKSLFGVMLLGVGVVLARPLTQVRGVTVELAVKVRVCAC